MNYVAVHDPEADTFDGDCVGCHADKLDEASLDEAIPGFHMLKMESAVIPGELFNDKCVYCHETVDLSGDMPPNLRRLVAVAKCSTCHSGGNFQFYQAQ